MTAAPIPRSHVIEDSLWLSQGGESWQHIAERLGVKITTIYRTFLRYDIPVPAALRAEANLERNSR